MTRKTMNICDVCDEHKATGACVICDMALCDPHAHFVGWGSYLVSRNKEFRKDKTPDAAHKYGPFCQTCHENYRYALEGARHLSDSDFSRRVKVASQNVGNAIAREMFRGRENDK